MGLQPFVGPWPVFQFLYLLRSRQDSLDRGSARRKVATHAQNNINTEQTHTDIHALSGIRAHDPSVGASEDSSCLRHRGHCGRQSYRHVLQSIPRAFCLCRVVITETHLMTNFVLMFTLPYSSTPNT
jgi:hypothetical protein